MNVAYQRLSPEEAAARSAERVRQAHQRIQDAVAGIQSGQQWRDYLKLQSRLHAYSGSNTLLIHLQMTEAYVTGDVSTPVPTYVAGFHTWKALGRSVMKGQHGFQILAPNRHTVRSAVSTDGVSRRLAREEQPGAGEHLERRQVVKGFRIEHVFAVEQTHGAELPAAPTPQLIAGDAPEGLWDNIVAQIAAKGYTVHDVPTAADLDGANGQTTWASRRVDVRADMDPASRIRTLIHEWAHVILHEPETLAAAYRDKPRPSRGVLEVEAESVSFVVSAAHGLATDDYAFPYVASWAGPERVQLVQASLARVSAAAHQIIRASTIEHTTGGRAPGLEQALEARRTSTTPTPQYAEPPPVPASLGIQGVAS